MLGDICNVCNCPAVSCTCETEPVPEVPCETGECSEWLPMSCVFWMGDPIPGTPIKKGTRLTEVVTHLLSRIKALEP